MFFKIKIDMVEVGLVVPLKKRDMENTIEKMIPDFDDMYKGDVQGNIWSKKSGEWRKMQPKKTKTGYLLITLFKNGSYKTFLVHRLIAKLFIENPYNLPEVNHKDEDKTNNCVDNLEWCTHEYNVNYGSRTEKASMTNTNGKKSKKVAQYALDFPCELIKVWESINEVERQLGLDHKNISSVCKHKRKSCGGFGWAYWEE